MAEATGSHEPAVPAHGIWRRCRSVSASKDGLGFLTVRQLLAHGGKTGPVNQAKTLAERPSRLELPRRIDEKLATGYRLLGEYRPDQDWSHLLAAPTRPTASPPPPAPPLAAAAAAAPLPNGLAEAPPNGI